MNSERLLQRFLQYVQINTTANERTQDYPSSSGQLELGRLVVSQLQQMGIADVQQDEHGIVIAKIPARGRPTAPVIAFNAHFDTSPETSGKNVRPNVIRNFDGNDIRLAGDPSKIITAEKCPELPAARGQTIITTDGTTLLGGDDKAGVAIMMELANTLVEFPEIEHGPIRLLFTCDEEIGRGTQHVDLASLGADVCYTFDGSGANTIDHETFSADMAEVVIHGVNIHPAIAKGKMVNAIRAASDLIARLPRDSAPETTDGRTGFVHPYSLEGGVGAATVRIIIRDFDTSKLVQHADLIREAAKETERRFVGAQVEIKIHKQYRNMADGLTQEPRAVAFAVAAHERLGRKANLSIIRGGTDGSQLTEKGLPTPNLSSGQHNFHSPLEWASLDEMVAACEVGIALLGCWAEV